MKNWYKIEHNKFGAYFIKNGQYWYLSDFERYGLQKNHWYNKIDYKIYNVSFTEFNNEKYIKCYANYKYSYMWK